MASEAWDEVQELMDKADIPAVHTLMATGIMRYDDEKNLGLVGMHGAIAANKAINQADLIIALGARFSDRVAQDTKKWGRKAKKVQIDIDISEIGKNVAVDMSCVGDVKDFLAKALLEVNDADHAEWIKSCQEWKKNEKIVKAKPDNMHPSEILSAVCDKVPEDTIYVTDVGQHQMWSAQYIKHTEPRHFLTSGGPNLMFGTNNLTISTQAGSTDLLISWIYKLTMNTPNQYQLASVLSILVFIVLVPFALYNFTHTKAFKDGEL